MEATKEIGKNPVGAQSRAGEAGANLSVGLAAGHTFTGTPEMVGNVVFNCGSTGEVMRLDKDGMIYKGQRIEDGGEAHKAFMEVMGMLKAANAELSRPRRGSVLSALFSRRVATGGAPA